MEVVLKCSSYSFRRGGGDYDLCSKTSWGFRFHHLHFHSLSDNTQIWSSAICTLCHMSVCVHQHQCHHYLKPVKGSIGESLHRQVDKTQVDIRRVWKHSRTQWHDSQDHLDLDQIKTGGLETKTHYVDAKIKSRTENSVCINRTFPLQWIAEQRRYIGEIMSLSTGLMRRRERKAQCRLWGKINIGVCNNNCAKTIMSEGQDKNKRRVEEETP